MENFVVSARKYRPGTFVSVVGQEHVTNTLKNAIKNNHLAHSFLFCGPRGVGKTTCARILAKAINCQKIGDDFEPCNECDSCKAFNQGQSLNIYELDAASNNSVEDIRSLIEQVRYAPQSGKYKVYIIDEVHMLSQQAFNAFLKTLEEPPSYAIFILATTEKHKIIPTILSRCQIFDFHRIGVEAITAHLDAICKKENLNAQNDALHIIAQKADGALRDALSIFDRIVSFSSDNITYQDVIDNLNILDYDYFFRVTEALLAEDVPEVLNIFEEILRNGFEGDNFMLGLSEHFRNLLVCKNEKTLQLLELTDTLKERYLQQAEITPASFLVSALHLSNECDIHYKASKNKRLQVEITLIKMCYINEALNLEASEPSSELKKKPSDRPLKQPEQKQTAVDKREAPKEAPSTPPQKSTAEKVQTETKTDSPLPSFKLSKLEEKTGKKKEKQKEEINNDATVEVDKTVKLDTGKLKDAWKKFEKHIKDNRTEGFIHSMVEGLEPQVLEHNIIQVTLSNSVEKERFQEVKPDLVPFLIKELKVPSIEIEVAIDKTKEVKNAMPYTNKDKFKKMAEKNPNLLNLREEFDLHIDY